MQHLLVEHERWKKKMLLGRADGAANSVLYESKSSLAIYNLSGVEDDDVGAESGREA